VRAFVVWEPILPTDIIRPTTLALSRVSDARAKQLWDPGQLIAKRMKQDAAPPQPEPACCEDEGVWWDLIAVYPRGVLWEERLPPAVYLNGTVAEQGDAAAEVIAKLVR
jgi:hypothetical protein